MDSTNYSPYSLGLVYRTVIGLGAGAIATIALLYLMQALIYSDDAGLEEGGPTISIDFLPVQEEKTIIRRPRKPKPPPKVDEPPPEIPDIPITIEAPSIGTGVPTIVAKPNIDIKGGIPSSGEYLPIVKVAPQYPRRALTRGLEGYVIVSFTVTKTGTVDNPVVVEAVPPNIFNRSAVNAASKFKYKPKIVDGVPVDVHNVQNKIIFEIEK